MYTLIDGKKTAAELKAEIAADTKKHIESGGKKPHLAAVLVGDNGASITYVNAKVKACKEVGFDSTLIQLSATITERELLGYIHDLNLNDAIDGFIVQLPLPSHIDDQKILLSVDPKKDVDGFHPENVGKMTLGIPTYIPATPFGILQLLKRYNIETESKHCVVVGRSNIVGKPMSILMSRNAYPGNATVTIVHSKTNNLNEICRTADILIVAMGKAHFIKADMVKQGAVIIDVGITRVDDKSKKAGYTLHGDVDFANVAPKCSFITPVPGGVGPMTIASLLKNTFIAAKWKRQ
jgi:methylenetetrahydrofolate dehydrogenase (NADP+)/methenyltetrahydrofolate cyclohydrolase